MKFPANELKPYRASMYCHVFENARVGVKRGLFWSITMQFAPVVYGDETFDCAMTCEWIPWRVRHWRELDGVVLDVDYGEEGVESSFYVVSHDTGTHTRLSLAHIADSRFRVQMEMTVDFLGYFGGDEDPAMNVAGDCEMEFDGLCIVPNSIVPRPITVSDVKRVAEQFVDLAAYMDPVGDGHAYQFRPKV